MMSRQSVLSLQAGPVALQRIREQGIRAGDFDAVIGASGGPKWFVLYGMDRYLSGSFFAGRTEPLELFGSSAGAWRLACMAHSDPVGAVDRLARHYSRQCYSSRPDRAEISNEARKLLEVMLGEEGTAAIAGNRVFSLRIIADRCRGPLASENSMLLGAGLGLCGVSNLISRKALGLYFERTVFHGGQAPLSAGDFSDLPTRTVALDRDNLKPALMASGSIPLAMEGVRNIPGAGSGVYRDGGMTDYHFDLPFNSRKGLVLYPHFYPRVTPGWFDKALPWRVADPVRYENVLLVSPSPEFVQGLPYGKIPDRKDFTRLDDSSRLRYWQQVLAESERLAEAFSELVSHGRGLENLKPFGSGADA